MRQGRRHGEPGEGGDDEVRTGDTNPYAGNEEEIKTCI